MLSVLIVTCLSINITFNHRKIVLNQPEELSPFKEGKGVDNVVEINSNVYRPEGMTALYDVIYESLQIIYDQYLKNAMIEDKRIDKVSIGVLTDGEDTVLDSTGKKSRISDIVKYIRMLRGAGNEKLKFLVSSVLIGLTSTEFSEKKLQQIKEELTFDESISINQADEKSIRKAFKLFSTNALNV